MFVCVCNCLCIVFFYAKDEIFEVLILCWKSHGLCENKAIKKKHCKKKNSWEDANQTPNVYGQSTNISDGMNLQQQQYQQQLQQQYQQLYQQQQQQQQQKQGHMLGQMPTPTHMPIPRISKSVSMITNWMEWFENLWVIVILINICQYIINQIKPYFNQCYLWIQQKWNEKYQAMFLHYWYEFKMSFSDYFIKGFTTFKNIYFPIFFFGCEM